MWDIVQEEYSKEYFKKMTKFLEEERKQEIIYPNEKDVLRAFDLTKFDNLKVVILGQDPYFLEDMADGLAFSTRLSKTPKSLLNIKKELKSDLGIDITKNNNLDNWAKEGVLLLNTILTVRKDNDLSHRNIGWETFTLNIFNKITKLDRPLVFILWGNKAIEFKKYIKNENHLVLTSSHPSPLAAYRGFFGSKPFSKTNDYLISKGLKPINFNL